MKKHRLVFEKGEVLPKKRISVNVFFPCVQGEVREMLAEDIQGINPRAESESSLKAAMILEWLGVRKLSKAFFRNAISSRGLGRR